MGRRKVEMKRIEDKSSRQVTFSKRRGGLMKKARELSVLCGVDVGVVVFSCSGKLYDFCSGTDSLSTILQRYKSCCQPEGKDTGVHEAEKLSSSFHPSRELLQMADRYLEKLTVEELNVTDLVHFEEQFHDALIQTRSRKTQLMMDSIVTLNEEEEKTRAENEFLKHQILTMQKDINRNELPRNHSCPKHTALYFLG